MWVALALAVAVQSPGVTPQELVHLSIVEGRATPPAITLYLDVLDATNAAPSALDPVRLTVSVGANQARVTSVTPFSDTGQGIALIFAVDVSKSISARDMQAIQEALRTWLRGLGAADRAALTTFGDATTLETDFSADRAALNSAIDRLRPAGQRTKLHLAIKQALELGRRRDADVPLRRAVILFSDGLDEGSGLAEDDVAAAIREDRIPIYAIGYSRLQGDARRRGLDALARFSANSGGTFREVRSGDIGDVYAAMQQAIARVFVATAACDDCDGDGTLRRVQVSVASGSRILADGMDVRMQPSNAPRRVDPPAVVVPSPPSSPRWWPIAAGGGIAALVAGGMVMARRKTTGTQASTAHAQAFSEGIAVAVEPRFRVTCHVRNSDTAPLSTTVAGHARMGTSADCVFQLRGDAEIAPEHCELIAAGQRLFIRSLDPTIATLVNGVPVTSRLALDTGDLILLGRTEMRITFEALT